MAANNYFECPVCGIVTQHIKVSVREAMARDGKSTGGKLFLYWAGLVNDMSGAAQAWEILFGVANYKCTKCSHIMERSLADS